MRSLVARGLLRGLPSTSRAAHRALRRSTVARAALGYLHGNCSYCHTMSGELASLKFSLQYPFAVRFDDPPAMSTTIGKTSKFYCTGRRRAIVRAPAIPIAACLHSGWSHAILSRKCRLSEAGSWTRKR